MSIEIYHSYKNLVVAPVIPECEFDITGFQTLYYTDTTACNIGFVNINQAAFNAIASGYVLIEDGCI